MSCNCKANRDIAYLKRHYGNSVDVNRTQRYRFGAAKVLKTVLAYITVMILSPVVLIYVLVASFGKDRTVNINRFIRFFGGRNAGRK